MKKMRFLTFNGLVLLLILVCSCSKEEKKQIVKEKNTTGTSGVIEAEKAEPVIETKKDPADFVPEGYTVFEKSFGDLNNDGAEDCILIIKKVDPSNIITDEYRGKLDRNRRGLIILFKKNNGYELASRNYSCFSSENEEGGGVLCP
ncbi:hypothetical protein SAMN05421639_10939 [Chryseobacterium shigense]|uniref:Lipoprotein n=1 Tax=Chryseobacterium shigense TaxID=297244 RepID=A0A1N7KAK9_9FLAO|nr:hypothetical protein [Chryseobacterium shigense]SIS58631.1 hypothetical protein SAMN05421639_10939 [Chryseobacterium shigense]